MTIPEHRSALEADPGNWELRAALVEALVGESRHEAAVEVVNQGEAIPREAGLWLAAGRAYAAVGALEQAQGLVASALEIDPDHAASLEFTKVLQSRVAPLVVSLTADDVEGETAAPVEASGLMHRPTIAGGTDGEPMMLPKVSFSSTESEAIHAAEAEVKRIRERAIGRDKVNSVVITVLLHVVIVFLLTLAVTKIPPNVPPQIVATSAPSTPDTPIENVKMEKPTLEPSTAVATSSADIISVSAVSNVSISNVDVQISDVAMETSVAFNPSMSLGMPTSSESKMMFGQPMEGNVLGVILDVSGSMAEYLPQVVREVDKNFKDAPVVYVRNMLVRRESSDEGEIRLIVPEEVIPTDPVYRTPTPFWFLWNDLPRKAPQRYVDRLIETFKTRPNQFLSVGRWDNSRVNEAVQFLMEQKVDSIYIFSDFEDFVDEEVAAEIGQSLGRRKIKTYVQPAQKGTEFLDTMTKKIANRTLGRQMPSLVSILAGTAVPDDPLAPPKPVTPEMTAVDVKYATPRPTITSEAFYGFKPNKDWKEIHRLSEPEYDAVFYGPEARVEIFLKSPEGYIQSPITFYYHSWKEIPDHPDPRARLRRRDFLRLEETPSFDGKEIIWKMVLEDELKFRVHLYLGRKGMNATYVCDPNPDGTNYDPYIYFRLPALAVERNDLYFNYDLPAEGVKLAQVRTAVKPNEVIFNLPRQDRDRFAKSWAELGFEPGYNTRNYTELMRRPPNGIRDLVVQGPSFGPRKFHARTTSSKVLLDGGAGRADIEAWESFYAVLRRPADSRTKFTKTEAIEIEIE
jgi:hypothetical protein